MTCPARAADPAAPHAPAAPSVERATSLSEASLGITTAQALEGIAQLANELCEHLTDAQWRTAARIRDLAETAQSTDGAS